MGDSDETKDIGQYAIMAAEFSRDALLVTDETDKTVWMNRGFEELTGFSLQEMVCLAILAVAIIWLPGALVRNTVAVLPESTRLAVGTSLLGHMSRITGDTCRAPLGSAALTRLKSRSLQGKLRKAYVVPKLGIRETVVLPGRLVLLDATLVEDHDTPAVAAGYMLKALQDRMGSDPMTALLEHSGSLTTFRLLTTGALPDDALSAYAEHLLSTPEPVISFAPLLDRFKEAQIPATAFAYGVDVTGETTLDLIESDPYRGLETPRLLSDGDWISLQAICAETG